MVALDDDDGRGGTLRKDLIDGCKYQFIDINHLIAVHIKRPVLGVFIFEGEAGDAPTLFAVGAKHIG